MNANNHYKKIIFNSNKTHDLKYTNYNPDKDLLQQDHRIIFAIFVIRYADHQPFEETCTQLLLMLMILV